MNVAYVTTSDPDDRLAWSGTSFRIRRALEQNGHDLACIGNLRIGRLAHRICALKNRYYKALNTRYDLYRDPLILGSFARQVRRRLLSLDCDIIFSPGTIPIAYLRTSKPTVFWTDATFASMVDFYPGLTGLCRETIRCGHRMEQEALKRCRLALYTSTWAAESALRSYQVDESKVHVVEFGANSPANFQRAQIEHRLSTLQSSSCRLLFIGVDWSRKGGDKAVAVAQLLNQRGLPTELHIVGCDPPDELPDCVVRHGFISSDTVSGQSRLQELFLQSHFLLVPSIAECFGIVFAEASSYGVPSLATNVGGIPSAIRDGHNGFTLDLKASAIEYCLLIERLMSAPKAYASLTHSTYETYTRTLNWEAAGRTVTALLERFCS